MKRRNFIDRTSRWFLLGGLLGTSGFLAWRRQFGDPNNCFTNPFCKSCNQFASCEIATELKTKSNEKHEGK